MKSRIFEVFETPCLSDPPTTDECLETAFNVRIFPPFPYGTRETGIGGNHTTGIYENRSLPNLDSVILKNLFHLINYLLSKTHP
jgi:hypothetical protein